MMHSRFLSFSTLLHVGVAFDIQEKVNSYYFVQRDGTHVKPSQLANDALNARAKLHAWPADTNHALYRTIICSDGSRTLIPSMFAAGAHILPYYALAAYPLTPPHTATFMSAGLASIGWSPGFALHSSRLSLYWIHPVARGPFVCTPLRAPKLHSVRFQ